MKGDPKSSLRPFLHLALQLYGWDFLGGGGGQVPYNNIFINLVVKDLSWNTLNQFKGTR